MFGKLLWQDILSRVRSPFWQKSIGINIVLFLLAAYLMLNFLVLGFFLDDILRSIFPDTSPLSVFNRFVLYYLLIDLITRFFLQNLPVSTIQPYLLLPIRRSRLVHYLLIKSIPNFFNFLPWLLLIPFLLKVVIPALGTAAWIWLAAMALWLLINHFLATWLKRTFNLHPVATLLALIGLGGLLYLDFREVIPLSAAFSQWLNATLVQPWYLLLPIILLVGLYRGLYRSIYNSLYLDRLSPHTTKLADDSGQLTWLNRFGRIGQLLQLDLQLIRRNKRPRIMAIMSIFFLLYPLIILQDELIGKLGLAVFVGIFTTGIFMINYGQFMLAWESSFFDFLRVRQISIREYFEAKFYLFGLSTLVMLILSMLYGLLYPQLPLFFLAGAIYNIGVSSFILMFMATYNVRKIDLGKGAFMNWEGVGASQFIIMVPILVIPMLVYWVSSLLGGMYVGLAAISLLGGIGFILKNPILDRISRHFDIRKYIMTSSFKND